MSQEFKISDEQVEFYNVNGYLILEKVVDHSDIDAYLSNFSAKPANTPTYLDDINVLNMLCSQKIQSVFEEINCGVALHMDRALQSSSGQPWHQDASLSSYHGGQNYAGVWIALEDVDIEAGPFEVLPGSHKWDLDYEKIYGSTEEHRRDVSHILLGEEIKSRNVEPVQCILKKGDAIIWHGRLLHRGGEIKNVDKSRKSLVGHYCNGYAHNAQNEKQPDASVIFAEMSKTPERFARNNSGGYYFIK